MALNLRNTFKLHRAILTRPDKRRFLWLSALFFLSSLFDIVGISAIGYFLAVMLNPSVLTKIPLIAYIFPTGLTNTQTLLGLGMFILAVFLLKTCLSFIVQKHLVSYCFRVGSRIRVQLMEQYLYLPYSYLLSNNTSELINRVLVYANSYSSLSLLPFMTFVVHMIFVLSIIFFLFYFYPLVTFLLIALFGSMLIIHLLLVRDKLYAAGLNINQASQQIVQSVQEGLSGLKEVRILGKECYFISRIQASSHKFAESNGFVSIFQRLPFYFLESGMFIFIITLCLIELSLGMDVQVIIALCGMLVTAGVRLLPSLYQSAVAVVSMQSNQHTLETIYDNLFNYKHNYKSESIWPGKNILEEASNDSMYFNEIRLHNISYNYPNSELKALDNIQLTIKRGQAIGIVGMSGAGKSTLVDLLLGLLKPTQGEILCDGQPVHDSFLWVKKFAYIPQDIHLLDASIKQNIVFGEVDQNISLQKLNKAIDMAQLSEVIAQLPQGIETNIGENGIKLSGGQRQRIALARAFYHERDIIVMDEATAALDNDTEQEVVQAINRLHQLKTLIIIAHRYTTVQHCDIIYRLNQGKIVDAGSYYSVIEQHQQKAVQSQLSPELS